MKINGWECNFLHESKDKLCVCTRDHANSTFSQHHYQRSGWGPLPCEQMLCPKPRHIAFSFTAQIRARLFNKMSSETWGNKRELNIENNMAACNHSHRPWLALQIKGLALHLQAFYPDLRSTQAVAIIEWGLTAPQAVPSSLHGSQDEYAPEENVLIPG